MQQKTGESSGRGDVTVNTATNSDHAFQFIGNTTIGTLIYGATEDEKAQRQVHAILRWLSPSDEAIKLQSFIHGESRSNHKLEDAGLWFIHSKSFKSWLEGNSRLTWVNGGMGCGKTVLFFLAVEKVREMCRGDGSKNFGYFYCTSRGPFGQSIAVLFRSLLRQLCHPSMVPAAIISLYDLCDEGLDRRSPTVHELARTLKEIVDPSSPSPKSTPDPQDYYLLIDGLDELEPLSREELLKELQPLFSQYLLNVHILVTSRDHREIKESLQEGMVWDLLHVDTKSVQEDIRAFVISEIKDHRGLSRLPQQTRNAILSRVVDQSNGMFRWAFLQVQSLKALRPPVTSEKVEDKLRNLPKGLDETYDRMLNNLDEFDKPRARRALMWLVFSARQLYVEELVEACAFDVEKSPMVENKLDPTNIELLLQDLVRIRPPISTNQDIVEPQTHTVMLEHASIREFLVKERKSAEEPAGMPPYFAFRDRESNIILAQSCLTYLLCYNTYALRDSYEDFPLRPYAWYHWEDHIDLQAEHCVPTIPTAILRRKARRLFNLIKSYLSRLLIHNVDPRLIPGLLLKGIDGAEFSALWVVLNGLIHIANSHNLDLHSLTTALNIPFFHLQYDEFCPVISASTPDRDRQSDYSSPGAIIDLGLRGRVASYKYRSLSTTHTLIRLLEILPAVDPETMIQCRLFEARLEDAPPYAALSYVWGGVDDKCVIMIEGHRFHVSKSQLILLRSMRSRSEEVNPAIWLDALCINQMDHLEKATQVMIMSGIFAQAREVVVGLSNGDDDGSDDQAVHLLADLASAMSSLTTSDTAASAVNLAKQAILGIDRSGGWESILEIFQNPWWRRTWVIQEIVLGFKAVILFGSMSFNFNIVEKVMLAESFIKDVLRESRSPNLVTIEKNPGWRAAKQIVRTRLEYRQNGEFALPLLLWRFQDNLSTDPRDRIFAFLGLCKPQSVSSILVSYQLGVEEVALQTSQWILQTYKTLDMLSILSAFENNGISQGRESSWSLPLRNSVGPLIERRPLNPGVFAGIDSFKIYSAAGTETQSILFLSESQSKLTVRGTTFDKIEKVLGPAHFDMSSTEPLIELCKDIGLVQSSPLVTEPNQKTIEAKWRTLLANQWPLGTKLSMSTCQGVKVPPQTESDEKALFDVVDVQFDLPQLEGRRIIITSGGRLGLALEEVLPGDSIVILPGGALPYVLRPHPNGNWVFSGECYVHDCMDGQVVWSVSQPGQEWWTEIFEII